MRFGSGHARTGETASRSVRLFMLLPPTTFVYVTESFESVCSVTTECERLQEWLRGPNRVVVCRVLCIAVGKRERAHHAAKARINTNTDSSSELTLIV